MSFKYPFFSLTQSGLPIKDTDEYGEMMIVLSRCAIEYEEKSGAFSTFAQRAMENRMKDILRYGNRRRGFNPQQLNGNDILIPDHEQKPDLRADVELLLSPTTDDQPHQTRYRDILRWYYLDGQTVEQIAERLKVTKQAASKALRKARKFLKNKYGNRVDDFF